MLPEFYNILAMHGTIMVFLGVVPLAVGGFGNFVMPLRLALPTWRSLLNMASYWYFGRRDTFTSPPRRRGAV